MIDVKELTQNVIDGTEDPLMALSILKGLQNEIKSCIAEVEPSAIAEAEKYEKTFEHKGLKIELRQGRKVWNFKNLPEWQKAEKAKIDCEEQYKAAYSNFEKGLSAVKQDGEVLELPEVTYGKPSIIIKNK